MQKSHNDPMEKSRSDALSRTDELIDIVELDDSLLDDAVGGGDVINRRGRCIVVISNPNCK
jgi:hypothetical protein